MFHFVVCIKQVPDSHEIRIDPKTNTLIRKGVPAVVNEYDVHGLEAALLLKERYGARVTVVTMGPPSADQALKECIAMGADEGVLVSDRAFAGADTLATSYVIAQTINKAAEEWGPVDIVFCGKQTSDGDTGQVGPGVACRLDLEQLTYVEAIDDFDPVNQTITVRRRVEDGEMVVRSELPVLITALAELNEPRRASLPGVLRSVRYQPLVWTTADFVDLDRDRIGLRGSPTIVSKSWVPEAKPIDTEMLGEATVDETVGQLLERLESSRVLENLGI